MHAGYRSRLISVLALIAVLFLAQQAYAGRSCEAKPISVQAFENGMALAEITRAALDTSGAKVVILARAGQDLRKYKLRYSHLGFAVKHADGRWLLVHKLNHCGSAEAALFRQGLAEFFLDDLFRFEGAYVIPRPDLQDALHTLLTGPDVKALHVPAYSVVAYPWSTRYQQSNQWAIEMIALAMSPHARTREQAQAWLKLEGYTPTTLNIPLLTRLGGRLSAANVAFDDHPNEKRFLDRIETVTVDSVFAWLTRAGYAGEVKRVGLGQGD